MLHYVRWCWFRLIGGLSADTPLSSSKGRARISHHSHCVPVNGFCWSFYGILMFLEVPGIFLWCGNSSIVNRIFTEENIRIQCIIICFGQWYWLVESDCNSHHYYLWSYLIIRFVKLDDSRLENTTLHYFTLFYFILLYFTLFYFILLYFTLFYFILLYFTLFYFILLYFTLFYFILLYFTLFYFILLYFTLFYFILLDVTLLYTYCLHQRLCTQLRKTNVIWLFCW